MLKQQLRKTGYNTYIKVSGFFRNLSPTQMVVLSFMFVIFIGSLLLFLPISQASRAFSTNYIDCLFTAVSASCVTGLVTVTTATNWSLFGQIIIILMIQIGGLSFITLFAFFAINIGRKINIKNRMTIQASLNQNNLQGMVRIVKLAIKGTFLLEGIGAVALFLHFWLGESLPIGKSLYYGVFHSISSFCNAGFDVIGDVSLSAYVGAPVVNITVMLLIIMGGIGFTVWKDVTSIPSQLAKRKKAKRLKLSLHTKLALIFTVFLILFGAVYFFATEYHNPNTLGSLQLGDKIWASFFQSVTLRTAGFFTIDQNAFTESSKFVSSLLMLIGGSPGGTAGGVKTVTLAIIVCSIWSTLRGKSDIDIMHRRVPYRALQKAITVVGVMFTLWFIVATILEFTEVGSAFPHTFVDLLFEVASALGTVGLTTGITPHLTDIGKILIMSCMFIGRLGPISIAVALQRRLHATEDTIHWPEEDVLIG